MAENKNLPELPAWRARSFYAQLLLVATVLAQVMGYDMGELVAHAGFDDPGQVLDFAMAAMPLVLGFWAWFERRAPNYRLVLKRVR